MSSAQLLLDRAAAGTEQAHSYILVARHPESHGRTGGRPAPRGEQLLPGEQAAFVAMIDTVYDEEDFGDAFTYAD